MFRFGKKSANKLKEEFMNLKYKIQSGDKDSKKYRKRMQKILDQLEDIGSAHYHECFSQMGSIKNDY